MKYFRQSDLRAAQDCMRRLVADLELPRDVSAGNTGAAADLGTFVHVVIFRYLTLLREHDQQQMGSNDLEALVHETYADVDIILPDGEFHDAEWMLRRFAEIRWNPRRIMMLEAPLAMEIACPDGEVRVFTGRPDIVYADPPHGVIIIDPKSGLAKPRQPRVEPQPGEKIIGWEYLSHRARYQGSSYAMLVANELPTIKYVIFRELHLRSGTWPESPPITRQAIEEHVIPKRARDMMKLDRALADPESPLRRPRAGRQCFRQCPVAKSCPIPVERRGEGAIGSQEEADAMADAWVVGRAADQERRAALKAWHEAGNVARCADGREARWEPAVGKGRKFDVHEPLMVEAR